MTNLLINQKIIDVKIAQDKMAMLFVADDKSEFIVRVDADCCSHTWIESVEMPALGLPFTILECQDLDLNKGMTEVGYDCIQFYGARIITDKGEMIIDYRNSSNGYYGGNVVWPGENNYWYGGVFGQNESANEWVDIEEGL